MEASLEKRLTEIKAAFDSDGFQFEGCYPVNERIGVSAKFRPRPDKPNELKRAYYVEGDHFTMGRLLGMMAEPAIARMAADFPLKVLDSFVHPEVSKPERTAILKDLEKFVLSIVGTWLEDLKKPIPEIFHQEIDGMYLGCCEANSRTSVTVETLWRLNLGTDTILAHLFAGKFFERVTSPKNLRVPLHCNSYVAPGDRNRWFFGRDFIFPTGGVYQDVACMVVYRPDSGGEHAPFGYVSQTAPGIIGSVAAVNSRGVAIGLNMTASRLCDPKQAGFSGLLLNRYCMEYAESAVAAKDMVIEAPRSVAWLYPIADASGKAFIVEAGAQLGKNKPFPYLDYIPRYYKRRLPKLGEIRDLQLQYGHTPPYRGAVARSIDYKYPADYLKWNEKLWNAFDRNPIEWLIDVLGDLGGLLKAIFTLRWKNVFPLYRSMLMQTRRPYPDGCFGERDYIDTDWTKRNCPGPFYFAPQRESREDVLVATNDFLSPEMRLVGMNEWTAIVARTWYDDFQWRYDELNKTVLDALDNHRGGLDDATAWSLINFLDPAGNYYDYYGKGIPTGSPIQVHGSVNLCELTGRTMKSLFGYYGDNPVTITLPRYL